MFVFSDYQPLASETSIHAFFQTILVLAIFGNFLLLLEITTKLIKLFPKSQVKQAKFLSSNCATSLRKKLTKLSAFSQTFWETVHAVRVNETKKMLSKKVRNAENAFIVEILALRGEIRSQYDKRSFSEEFPHGVLTCLLALSFRKTPICVLLDYFSCYHICLLAIDFSNWK